MEGEARRERVQRLEDPVGDISSDRGVDVGQDPDGRRLRPRLRRLARRRFSGVIQCLLEPPLVVLERLLGVLDGEVAPVDQQLRVELPGRPPLVDALVHERLRGAGSSPSL